MRTSNRKINKTLYNELKRVFIQLIADLKTPDEVDMFLKDFFTDVEYETFSKRIAIAYWLKKGRTYDNIKNNLKVSSATVSFIQTMMEKEGFKLALQKIEAEEWATKWADRIQKFIGKKK